MRMASLLSLVCAMCMFGSSSAPALSTMQTASPAKATPLILEKDEGDRRVWRVEGFQRPFVLKVDSESGGSSHLVFGTGDIPAGGKIDTHRHPNADEILYFQNGNARVHLGGTTREVHEGATVFIPANTWISVDNIGSEPIHAIFVFSAPGFDRFMRAESMREGEKMPLLTKEEDAEIMKRFSYAVVYQEP